MTTIIGVQYEDRCELMADNQVTGDNGRRYNHPNMVKISEVGNYLIAGSGEVGPCDIAQHIWKPPVLTVKDKKDVYHFMISKVMPSLRKCLKDNGHNFDDNSSNENRFNLLIAVGGHIFDIADDCSVTIDSNDIYGVGSGSAYAIGALCVGAELEESMDVAALLDVHTSRPYLHKVQYK